MAARFPDDDRLSDLLAIRAIEGLSDAEQAELDDLSANPGLRPRRLRSRRGVAGAVRAAHRADAGPLRARIEADAEAWLAGRAAAAGGDRNDHAIVCEPTAGHCLGRLVRRGRRAVLAFGWCRRDAWTRQAKHLRPARLRWSSRWRRLGAALADKDAALAALRSPTRRSCWPRSRRARRRVVLPWSATDDPRPAVPKARSSGMAPSRPGVMRLRGLLANDPAVAQYQLWIFDAERDDRFPVDGGVFDVPPGPTRRWCRFARACRSARPCCSQSRWRRPAASWCRRASASRWWRSREPERNF
jgi:hypothetical protein